MSDNDSDTQLSDTTSDSEIITEVEINSQNPNETEPQDETETRKASKTKKHKKEKLPITSTANMMKIKPTDQLVDIVGFVTYILKATYTANGKFVFEFLLSNEEGITVKCVCWSDAGRRLSQNLQLYHIIHINGAQAKSTNEQHNLGTLPIHLTIQRDSDVKIEGIYPYDLNKIKKFSLISSDLCLYAKQTIYLTGYLKTPFKILSSTLQKVDAAIGCIGEKTTKLNIRINSFSNNLTQFQIGDHLKLLGILNSYGDGSFFVSSIDNIALEDDEKYSATALLRCTDDLIFPSTSTSNLSLPSTSSNTNNDDNQSRPKKRRKTDEN